MNVSLRWLRQYIDTKDLSPETIGDILTSTGLEVEGMEEVETIPGGLKGVVVGEVLTCEKHPDADKLKLTLVNVGTDAPLHIVCGAPNAREGLVTIYAPPGAVIPKTKLSAGLDVTKVSKPDIDVLISFALKSKNPKLLFSVPIIEFIPYPHLSNVLERFPGTMVSIALANLP